STISPGTSGRELPPRNATTRMKATKVTTRPRSETIAAKNRPTGSEARPSERRCAFGERLPSILLTRTAHNGFRFAVNQLPLRVEADRHAAHLKMCTAQNDC